ncbi:AAA family ATPase [Umezawaea sp. Da 62-37]|uniref:AAA family ATPase n=1 Tax=Umezawaea sp. Da 62-37 TaxID=3075927 RepID=UPI0028F73B8D|nr:AAA family ATPase [Umezawaea sp. Da 62-37]WNV83887.1 AAA family ATPase [Umezawaea sp. Da 62-37]
MRSVHDVDIRQTRFAWRNYLPVGEVALLVGKPGVGKSTVVVDLAAKLTTGQLDGTFRGEPQHVLYSITEDSESTLKARLIAAGGDPHRLHLVDAVYGDSPDGTPLIVNLDLDMVREVIEARKPALFVLDALNSSLSGQLNDNSIVRPQLEKLRHLAQRTGTTILGIGHFRKATAGVDPVDAIGGAGAYTQVVRHALGCAAEDDDNYVLSVIKSNVVSVSSVQSLAYRATSATVMADDGGETEVGRIVWQGHSATSVVDLLQRSAYDDGDERADAAAWLTDYLAERGGEAAVLELLAEGHRAGFSKDALKRAKTGAKVRSEKADFGGGWVWRINPTRFEGSEGSSTGGAAPFAPFVRPSQDEDDRSPL